jgi:hypothetical protein
MELTRGFEWAGHQKKIVFAALLVEKSKMII